MLYSSTGAFSRLAIHLVPADGSSEPVQFGPEGISGLGWSADGDFILATDRLSIGDPTLVVLALENEQVDGFVPLPFPSFTASWSPDNTELVAVDFLTGAMFLVDADGTSLRPILGSGVFPGAAAWRPVPVDHESVLAGGQTA